MDLIWLDDMDPFGRELDDPLEELKQDVYHRLLELPGSNLDDPERGFGLEDALSGRVDTRLAARIEAELSKDDDIDTSRVTMTELERGSYRIEIEVAVSDRIATIVLEADANGVRRAA
jgi:hypothetical protein